MLLAKHTKNLVSCMLCTWTLYTWELCSLRCHAKSCNLVLVSIVFSLYVENHRMPASVSV